MNSIRKLKKDINVLTYELLSECFVYKRFHPDLSEDRFDEVIRKIVLLRNDLISRVNHPETDADSVSVKEHYRRVWNDLGVLMDTVNELSR
ncbi:MAG: hypothetical protein ACOYXB_15200 [Bacteroidota bacterium]